MKLTYLTGRASAVRESAFDFLDRALAVSGESEAILLVPDQLTLQSEIDALTGLGLPGSFRLQVLSPRRLYRRVFEQAGGPREALVDEQGRVMLMHAAAQAVCEKLTWYKGALGRPGFAQRCVQQLTAFKQAGLTPQDVQVMAQGEESALSLKLSDLAFLYEAYEQALSGRFMDGEDEAARACDRMADSAFLRGARVCVYGFDRITPTLRRVILSLLTVCEEVAVALVLAGRQDARDFSLFLCVQRSLEQLSAAAPQGAVIQWTRLQDRPRPGALGHLERELFCVPQTPYDQAPANVQLALCKNPQEEAEFAAALVRRLCRTKGWRYRDIAVACVTGDQALMGALRRAFQLYRVPLFLTEGRPASHHPLCICLLSALRAVTRGWAMADVVSYIRSGFSGLSDEECDLLVNYAQAHGLRGRAWRAPLSLGSAAELEAIEPLRQRAVQPLTALSQRAKEAGNLNESLAAVFGLLEDTGAYEQLEAQRERLAAQGLTVWAAEGAQVWNRVVEALEQMASLLPPQKMRLRTVYDLLSRALSAAVVKALPQSADAVEGGVLEHLRGKPVKALLVVGATDGGADGEGALLGDEEMAALRDRGADLGINAEERQRMRRLGLKSLLSMTEEYLLVSRSYSDASGRALSSGALMNEAIHLLPKAKARGGVSGDAGMLMVRLEQADAALCRLPGLLPGGGLPRAALKALEQIEGMEKPLERMRASFAHKVGSERLGKGLALKLLDPAAAVSASRLERFAACPFRHFVHYALRPEEFRPFALSPRDAGTFYHQALEKFVAQNGARLGALSPEEGQVLMDQLTGALAAEALRGFTDSALAQAEGEKLKRVARRAAAIIVRQFDGSRFRPASVELGIAQEEVRIDGQAVLGGRIDRVDLWESEQGQRYLRVIDYKTGGRTVSLQEIYYGLQLQLVLYLAAATAQLGGQPAGVFYFKVDDPLMDTESRDVAEVEREREKALRLDGLVLGEVEVVKAMAAEPDKAVNVAFNRDGSLRCGERVLDQEDFGRLMRHALDMAARMTAQMRQGDTQIAPAQSGGRLACRFCEYRTVCGFDERLAGAKVRKLKKLSGKEVLEALKQQYPSVPQGDSGN